METQSGDSAYPEEGATFFKDEFGERINHLYTLETEDIEGEAELPLETDADAAAVEDAYARRFELEFGEIIGGDYPPEVYNELSDDQIV